jgi:hypothetical protein
MPFMHKLSSRQWLILILLTVIWGINWPVMKIGVTGFPPLTFRMLCLMLGTPILGAALLYLKVPLRIERQHWPELLVLAVFNMFFWHGLIIIAVQSLSSGRAAILGYTMPMFSAVIGAMFFGNRLPGRAWAGVAAAALGVVLLLWHELSHLTGRPVGVLLGGGQHMGTGHTTAAPHAHAGAHLGDFVLDDADDHRGHDGSGLAVRARGVARPFRSELALDHIQRGAGVWFCPRRMVLFGAQLAAGGVNFERDADSGTRRFQRCHLAGRGAALARLGRRGADGGVDLLGAVALQPSA